MRVLGIGTGGDSGAAVIEDGRILAAVNEERLSRMKLVEGFPRGSIRETLRLSNTDPGDLDAVLVGAEQEIFQDDLKAFPGWFREDDGSEKDSNIVKKVAGKLARYRNQLPFLEKGYYAMLEPAFRKRRREVRRILADEFDIDCGVEFVDHHFCHVTSAYFTSGFDDALVVSMDGGGDGRSSLIYAVRDGDFEFVTDASAYNSLGNYYAYVTHICGFRAMKHEGKITGLAARGEPKYVPLLREFIGEEEGTIVNRGEVAFMEAIRELENQLPDDWQLEDLAASIQVHTEDLVRRYVGHWVDETGLESVALAGGIFANVRVNQEVFELPGVERVSVHPHMGDGGLSVGAALAASVPGIVDRTMPFERKPIEDVYLGRSLEAARIEEALEEEGLEPEPLDDPLEETVADLLTEGYVVARAAGRMEYGPRALGNRSILYHPTDPRVNDWLNENLDRTEFMPFAPATLYEAASDCFRNVDGARHPAEFMTITFDCTEWMKENMRGVVHVDGTARPQLVRKDRNPGFYRIIEAFKEKTGLPTVINTSFNMHEEPIVCTADDCVRAFLQGNLDYLAIGPYLVKHPAGVSHPMKKVEPALTTIDESRGGTVTSGA